MLDSSVAAELDRAAKVRDHLHGLLAKLGAGRCSLPSELSLRLRGCGYRVAGMFHLMACTAVAEKYRLAGKTFIADQIMALHSARADVLAREMKPHGYGVERLHQAAWSLQALCLGHKSIGPRQRRWKTPDLDIALCVGMAFSSDIGITPWVCQQPDLRYRWTDTGMVRLRFLADCWDAYAQCTFTLADQLIGLRDFPNHPEYC